MHTIELINDFHNSRRSVRISEGETLTPERVRRIRRDLCGSNDCTCSGYLGTRGIQRDLAEAGLGFEVNFDGSAVVVSV